MGGGREEEVEDEAIDWEADGWREMRGKIVTKGAVELSLTDSERLEWIGEE